MKSLTSRLPSSRSVHSTLAAVASAATLTFTVGSASLHAQDDAQISPETQRQIEAIRQDRESRTPAERKLNTQLIYATRLAAGRAAVKGAPELRSTAQAQADGRYKVKITAAVSAELLAEIKRLGGDVTSSYPAYRAIYATLPIVSLTALAERADVQFIGLPPKMQVHRDAQPRALGPVTSEVDTAHNDPEGDATTGAAAVRTKYGINGTGVKIGVISDSIDDGMGAYAAAKSAGYVPNNITVIEAGTGTAEGLAMLEIVHRIAPGATLYFGGPGGDEDFATVVTTMQKDGCQIIIDDLGFNDESPFQDGVAALAYVDAGAKGSLCFSAIGNSGNFDSGTSSCWEGDFVSTNKDGFLDFQAGTGKPVNERETVAAGDNMTFINLFWAEPVGNVTSQYNIYEVTPKGAVVQEASDDVTMSEIPNQSLDGVTAGDSIKVQLASGVARFLHLDTPGDNITFSFGTAGHGLGHSANDGTNVFSVAATPAASDQGQGAPNGPYPNLFTSANGVEVFSDDGPRRMFFKPDGTAYTPGNFTSTGGKVFARPDFTSADGVTCTPAEFAPFFGTSAAAPHAGALAGLALSYNLKATPAQIAAALHGGTVQITMPGPMDRDAGKGILLAQDIISALPANAVPVVTSAATATATTGQAFSYQITATNSPTKYGVYGLPDGISVDTKTGLISGTHMGVGKVMMTLHPYNAAGEGSASLLLTVKEQ